MTQWKAGGLSDASDSDRQHTAAHKFFTFTRSQSHSKLTSNLTNSRDRSSWQYNETVLHPSIDRDTCSFSSTYVPRLPFTDSRANKRKTSFRRTLTARSFRSVIRLFAQAILWYSHCFQRYIHPQRVSEPFILTISRLSQEHAEQHQWLPAVTFRIIQTPRGVRLEL